MTKGLPLTVEGIEKAQDLVNINEAKFWAVMSVESRGFGFLLDRRPKILFERHIFFRQTNGAFAVSHPDICNKKPGGYGAGGAKQYDRLDRAIALDRVSALKSASWGVGQVMGFNAEIAGFSDVESMVAAMYKSEDSQMLGMFNFIKSQNLGKYLENKQWEEFAKRYNGPGYKKNKYHIKLEIANNRYEHHPPPNIIVRGAQTCLTYLGFNPKGMDGVFGMNTQNALIRFEKSNGLPADGKLDQYVLKLLFKLAFQ